jgi:hypothetical protein
MSFSQPRGTVPAGGGCQHIPVSEGVIQPVGIRHQRALAVVARQVKCILRGTSEIKIFGIKWQTIAIAIQILVPVHQHRMNKVIIEPVLVNLFTYPKLIIPDIREVLRIGHLCPVGISCGQGIPILTGALEPHVRRESRFKGYSLNRFELQVEV